MFAAVKKHRVEFITFAVAFVVSVTSLVWIEYRKPSHGLLELFRIDARIRHKETGEVLLKGKTHRHAVDRHLNRIYGRSARSQSGPIPDFPDDEEEQRRRRNALEGADLRGMDFSKADLRRLELRDALCDGINLEFSDALGARFTGASFVNARFDGANLGNADLSSADLSGAACTRIDFSEAILRDANFSSSDISGSVFVGADCRGADFNGVKFSEGTNFRDANLEGARNLSGALRAHAAATGARFEVSKQTTAETGAQSGRASASE